MIHKNFIFLLFILFTQCNIPQNASTGRSASMSRNAKQEIDPQTGKCYAKCLMGDVYKTDTTKYLVYTGDAATENVDLETLEMEVKPATTKWVKKKADKNCLSSDPEDCMVWCLVEVPAEKQTLKVVKDTTQTKNYKTEFIYKKRLVKKGGFTEKREVICRDNVTPELVYQLQEALRDQNYFFSKNADKLNSRTKAALSKFQRENNLPVGQLDLETLEALNINPTDYDSQTTNPPVTNH